jgi:hypothetical protein
MNLVHTWRERQTANHRDKDARKKLAKELAGFTTTNDLIELSALLERYDDAETADIRRLVDWSRAA